MKHSLLFILAAFWLTAVSGTSQAAASDAQNAKREVHALKITVLVTNLAGDARAGDGEWGYSALVEADGQKILYDTGSSADMVLRNARALHVDLSDVEDVVLSHNHWDHVSGLMALRREFAKINPKAFSRVHVALRIFEPRLDAAGKDQNGLRDIRAEYLATGGTFVVHDKPTELLPGLWLTGPVPRTNPEKNWSPGLSLSSANGLVEDNVPEDSALVINTGEGTVILTGCGHAGIINIAEYARTIVGDRALLAVMGGVHLFAASDRTVQWTGARLKAFEIKNLLAGHCTGIEATYILRKATNLDRKTAMVSTVGSSFSLGRGIIAGALAQ
jgi:7,8-dihydropterin-6-yl-methyl-4-(beta-D-ribofuranosyl)aminobenzene 5'-phosphate synthase